LQVSKPFLLYRDVLLRPDLEPDLLDKSCLKCHLVWFWNWHIATQSAHWQLWQYARSRYGSVYVLHLAWHVSLLVQSPDETFHYSENAPPSGSRYLYWPCGQQEYRRQLLIAAGQVVQILRF